MGIHKVEIFCPRRVKVVSVVRRNTNSRLDDLDEEGTAAAGGGTGSGGSTPTSDQQSGEVLKGRETPPPTSPPSERSDEQVPHGSPTTAKASIGSKVFSTPPESVGADTMPRNDERTEEVIVTKKEHLDIDGVLHKVDVTYVVDKIEEEDDDQRKRAAATGVAASEGDAPSLKNASMALGSPDMMGSVSSAPARAAHRGVTFNATLQEADVAQAEVEEPEEKELNIEEELRELLLEILPGVRVTWNRCNSLRNMKGDNLDTMSVSFLEVAFYAKRRTAMHVATRVLEEIGIGKDFGRISVFPVEFFRPLIHNQVKREQAESERARLATDISAMMQFDELLTNVDRGAQLTFDFFTFLLVATIIAGAGLATNSTVSTVASMLVSPMMGPILATVLGTVLLVKGRVNMTKRNWRQAKKLIANGFAVEFLCLFVCVVVGIAMGFCFWSFRDTFGWGDEGNDEMRSRTHIHSLFIGVVVAVPSGAGVALSLLGKNGNSLVGVAISASLLPPAVNCGLYLALALIEKSSKLARMGAYSLCLTLINVVCIYISALVTFYIKHALPQRDFDGRRIDTFFGVEKFDMAAAGALPGHDAEQTELAKSRLANWMTPPVMRRSQGHGDVSLLDASANRGTSTGLHAGHREPFDGQPRMTRSSSQVNFTRRDLFTFSDDSSNSSGANSDGDLDFAPARTENPYLIPVIRPMHARTRTLPN